MVINGLNSGAKVYMADFEDSTSPTWANLIQGQVCVTGRKQSMSVGVWVCGAVGIGRMCR